MSSKLTCFIIFFLAASFFRLSPTEVYNIRNCVLLQCTDLSVEKVIFGFIEAVTSSSESSPNTEGRERRADFDALFWGKMSPYLKCTQDSMNAKRLTLQVVVNKSLVYNQFKLVGCRSPSLIITAMPVIPAKSSQTPVLPGWETSLN